MLGTGGAHGIGVVAQPPCGKAAAEAGGRRNHDPPGRGCRDDPGRARSDHGGRCGSAKLRRHLGRGQRSCPRGQARAERQRATARGRRSKRPPLLPQPPLPGPDERARRPHRGRAHPAAAHDRDRPAGAHRDPDRHRRRPRDDDRGLRAPRAADRRCCLRPGATRPIRRRRPRAASCRPRGQPPGTPR